MTGPAMTADAYWRDGAAERRQGGGVVAPFARDRRRLRVGLVNNMPDAALVAAERQFQAFLAAAAPERRVEFELFQLEGVERGEAARRRLAALYRPADQVADAGLDALIVTGAEPRAADLRAEPFWDGFTRLVDAAAAAGLPTLWSCLAAHAAVLHLDGVARRPLGRKCSGLFPCRPAAGAPLAAGQGRGWVTPHSRHNTLDEAELTARGYHVLSRSDLAGVDVFARTAGSARFLFLQGHPEYDPASLALEFKRDLQRYLDGAREAPPALPHGVFDPETALRLEALAADAGLHRRPELMSRWPSAAEITLAPNTWRTPAARLYRAWLAAGRGAGELRLSA